MLHVPSVNRIPFLSSTKQQREKTQFKAWLRTWEHGGNFLSFSLFFNAFLRTRVLGWFVHIFQVECAGRILRELRTFLPLLSRSLLLFTRICPRILKTTMARGLNQVSRTFIQLLAPTQRMFSLGPFCYLTLISLSCLVTNLQCTCYFTAKLPQTLTHMRGHCSASNYYSFLL